MSVYRHGAAAVMTVHCLCTYDMTMGNGHVQFLNKFIKFTPKTANSIGSRDFETIQKDHKFLCTYRRLHGKGDMGSLGAPLTHTSSQAKCELDISYNITYHSHQLQGT